MCWQMFMFWFLKSITFENRCECKTEGKRLWVHTGCLEVMLQAVKATIQGESARAQRRVRAHVVKSAQSVREKLNHTAIQAGGQTEVTESWCGRMISDAVSLGNFKRVSGAGVTNEGLLGYQCSHGYKLLGTRGPNLLFLGKKVCVIMNNNAVLILELIQPRIAWIAAVFLYFFFYLLHFWELLKTEMQWTTNISRYVCERVVKRC